MLYYVFEHCMPTLLIFTTRWCGNRFRRGSPGWRRGQSTWKSNRRGSRDNDRV